MSRTATVRCFSRVGPGGLRLPGEHAARAPEPAKVATRPQPPARREPQGVLASPDEVGPVLVTASDRDPRLLEPARGHVRVAVRDDEMPRFGVGELPLDRAGLARGPLLVDPVLDHLEE